HPTVESTVDDTQTFTVTTSGLYSAGAQQPASFMVTVHGHGIDRHIQAADVVFPDTYRNPTADQVPTATCGATHDQPCAVKVCNTGEATLNISMVTDPDDAFDLMSTGPFTVASGTTSSPTCTSVPVQFKPTAYGSFTGTVTLMNNDNGAPMSIVHLSG